MTKPDPITADEMMVVCIARQIQDGEIVAQGLNTPLVAAAYLLARKTHAPNLYFASAIGQTICREPAPLSLVFIENLWLEKAMANGGFMRAIADLLPSVKPKEFFRPAQVDPYGNFNNIAFGEDHHKPRMRLPGSGGIPDVTTFLPEYYLYVPRHSRVTFVEKLDYLSGLGHHPERIKGAGPKLLISDLGVFDYFPCDQRISPMSRMRMVSYHPGTTPDRIQTRTGFNLLLSPDLKSTPLPTDEELNQLRNEIDPLGIRKLELLSGSARRVLLHKIIAQEIAQ